MLELLGPGPRTLYTSWDTQAHGRDLCEPLVIGLETKDIEDASPGGSEDVVEGGSRPSGSERCVQMELGDFRSH